MNSTRSQPLRLEEIATILIAGYGLGSPRSPRHRERMIHALEASGLTWRHLCPEHEDVIDHCSTCSESGWHLQAPTVPNEGHVIGMEHVENFVMHVGHQFEIPEEHEIEGAIILIEDHLQHGNTLNREVRERVIALLRRLKTT